MIILYLFHIDFEEQEILHQMNAIGNQFAPEENAQDAGKERNITRPNPHNSPPIMAMKNGNRVDNKGIISKSKIKVLDRYYKVCKT